MDAINKKTGEDDDGSVKKQSEAIEKTSGSDCQPQTMSVGILEEMQNVLNYSVGISGEETKGELPNNNNANRAKEELQKNEVFVNEKGEDGEESVYDSGEDQEESEEEEIEEKQKPPRHENYPGLNVCEALLKNSLDPPPSPPKLLGSVNWTQSVVQDLLKTHELDQLTSVVHGVAGLMSSVTTLIEMSSIFKNLKNALSRFNGQVKTIDHRKFCKVYSEYECLYVLLGFVSKSDTNHTSFDLAMKNLFPIYFYLVKSLDIRIDVRNAYNEAHPELRVAVSFFEIKKVITCSLPTRHSRFHSLCFRSLDTVQQVLEWLNETLCNLIRIQFTSVASEYNVWKEEKKTQLMNNDGDYESESKVDPFDEQTTPTECSGEGYLKLWRKNLQPTLQLV